MERLTPSVHPKAWGEERYEFEARGEFPLLVKTLFARDRMSVQVHPGEATAKATGGAPKAEMWCMLEPGDVWAGLKAGVGESEVRRALAEGTLDKLLVRRELKRFDAIYIAPGTVHCAGGGARFYEVQQDSDTTWRLYDWNRRDANGVSRPLHIEKAIASIDWSLPPPRVVRDVATPWFVFRQLEFGEGGGEIAAPADSPLLAFDAQSGASTLLAPGERLAAGAGRHFATTLPPPPQG